ncbi:MAG: 5'-nucleotidase C-terminal domain-containing protein [Ignavibacteria bacterium]
MKKYFLLISSFFLLSNVNTFAQDTLTILHLNDTHSTLSPVGPRNELLQGSQGGIARAATIIGLTKMSEPNVLTLHAGDVFIGDLFFNVYFGVAEFQLLNSLGLDAMTVGNHEWDLTPSTLLASLQASFAPGEGFPLLSANLIFPDFILPDTLRDYIFPYTIKQVGNIKVGIFGLTTPEANVTSLPSPYFLDTDIVQIAAAMVDSLTTQNCNVIILLSHLGLNLDKAIASNIPGINVIVGGHDHYLLEAPIEVVNPLGGTTYIVQAKSNYLYMGKLQLEVNADSISLLNYQVIPLDKYIPEEPQTAAQVNSLIAGIEALYGPVYTEQLNCWANDYFDEVADSLMFPGNHDTPIGNLVTDAFRWKTGTQIAVEAGGSTSQPIYPVLLTAADIFRVFGYGFNEINGLGFRIVTFDILGSDLWKVLDSCLETIELNDEFLPQVSGMKYNYNPNLEPGTRIISVTVNENPLDTSATYSVTGNELLVSLLTDYFHTPISNIYLYEDSTEYQVLLDYLIPRESFSPIIEGRIAADISIGVENENYSPYEYALMQNYPNPFNPATNFEFRIADFELVSLKVYDILGNEVATIVNEELPAGNYKYQWNASRLASGVYFYQLRTGKFEDTKKLILMK